MSVDEYSLVINQDGYSPIVESYRKLRTNIQISSVIDKMKTLLFTSAGPREGKSTTVANLAITLASANKKVVILDCDLRKPAQYKIFGMVNKGLVDILVNDWPVDQYIQQTNVENLRLLASGSAPLKPSELLGLNTMGKVIERLKMEADYVLLDTSPVLAVTDTCVLASQVDGVVLVLDACAVKPKMAQMAKELLLNANACIAGVVLNRLGKKDEQAYYYY